MKFKYTIGDLVALRNHPYFVEKTTSEGTEYSYIGSIISCSSDNYPLMMVKECVQSLHKGEIADSKTGEIKDVQVSIRKYLCIWYDSFEGKFQETFLKEDSICKFPKQFEFPVDKEIEKGAIVFLNTSLAERYKQIYNQNKQNDHYVASSFLVIDKIYATQNEWINTKFGYKEKITSTLMLKVKWFNVAKSKYSEEQIPYECFQKYPHLIDRTKWQNIDGSECSLNVEDLSNLLSLLESKSPNYRVQNSADGLSLEELIYFYIRSEKKVILDDRVHAFDKYLKVNKLVVKAHRVSLNSRDCENFVDFKTPVDLVLEDSSKNLLFVDILTGNSIVKDGLEPNFDVTIINSDEDINTLSIYNNRLNVIKKLIEKKYSTSCKDGRFIFNYSGDTYNGAKYKLLIINRKMESMIKEIDYVEDQYLINCVKTSKEEDPQVD